MASSSPRAAFVVAGRRNHFVDQLLRRLAQDAGGFAAGIEVDGSALRWLGFAGDAGGGERGGVGDGDVAVDAIEKRRVTAGDLVEILARGQRLLGPQRVIPVAAGEPVAGGRGLREGLDLGQHLGERLDAGEVDVELGAAGAAKMRVRVVEAGKDEGAGVGAVQIAQRGVGSGQAGDLARWCPRPALCRPAMAMACTVCEACLRRIRSPV